MKQSLSKIAQIGLVVTLTSVAHAQSVTPLTTSTIIPTTAASPVVTATTATTATTTTSTTTLYQIYMDQVNANLAAAQANAEAQAKATQRGQQFASILQLGVQYCPFFREDEAQKLRKNLSDSAKEFGKKANDPNSNDPSIDTSVKKEAADSKAVAVELADKCESFIKKNGEPGDVGSKILAEVRENGSAFAKKDLKDAQEYCPNYSSMDTQQRNMFWVWAMMSMSNTESSCDPKIVKQKKGQDPSGLFQIGKDICSKNLLDGMDNAECSVKHLAKEMGKRDTLFAKDGTYWAAIKSDDPAHERTKAMISKYSGCGGSAQASADAPSEPPKKKAQGQGGKHQRNTASKK